MGARLHDTLPTFFVPNFPPQGHLEPNSTDTGIFRRQHTEYVFNFSTIGSKKIKIVTLLVFCDSKLVLLNDK